MKPNTSEPSPAAFASAPVRPEPGLSLPVRTVLAGLSAYKLILSPLFFTGACRFLPTCSDYAREAVIRHGVARGSWLALKRLGRCHPFCEAGHDPVPQRAHETGSRRRAEARPVPARR